MKTKGDSGQDVSQIIGNKITFVGGDNPNVYPSCRVDGAGRSKTNVVASTTQGAMELPSTYTEYQAIDNSGDHHGGTYNIIATNKVTIDAAGGGINLNSTGNINLNACGGLANIMAVDGGFSTLANVTKINSTEVTILGGKELNVNTSKISFNNTLTLAKNLFVAGGAAINGELYVSHITCPITSYDTSWNWALDTYFKTGLTLIGTIAYAATPVIIDGTPAAAPAGAMAATFTLSPITTNLAMGFTAAHCHKSIAPAMTGVSSPADVWEEAADCASNKKVNAKPNTPWGRAMENITSKAQKMVKKAGEEMVKKSIDKIF